MNDDALIERIADALDEAREDLAGFHAKDMARDILPIIRAAQADAWDEGQASGWDEAQEQWQINGMVGDMWKHADTPNPYRSKDD